MRRRAFALIVVLMVLVMLVIVGMALMGRRAPQYEAAQQANLEIQARALAEAGIADARVKLEKDPNFPPVGDRDQKIFSYSEPVFSLQPPGDLVGYYLVTVDTRWADPQESLSQNFPAVITVISTGVLGPETTNSPGACRIKMELTLDPNFPPTQSMRITDWVQEGGLPELPPPAPF